MFPREIWENPIWRLCDNTSGQVVLKHPSRRGLVVECPHCGEAIDEPDEEAIRLKGLLDAGGFESGDPDHLALAAAFI